eukprot:6190534-Amphidinium_carterae.1
MDSIQSNGSELILVVTGWSTSGGVKSGDFGSVFDATITEMRWALRWLGAALPRFAPLMSTADPFH